MSEHDEDDKLDLSEWPTMEPPAGFADRVIAEVRPDRKRMRWGVIGGGAAVLALAAALALRVGAPPSRGEAIAKERTELAMGTRARVVLEPGASLRWDGDDVTQSAGDVFYRVEPGARFVVHTQAGDVEVKGTCFTVKLRSSDMQKRDVKAGVIGAALSTLAFVAVYEGKVAVSHAGERVELTAGETAKAGADGVKKTTGDVAAAPEATPEEKLAEANTNLVDQVREYRKRLEAVAKQKSDLEEKLEKTQEKLEAAQHDGSAPAKKNEFDLSQDDWKELAKDGTLKFALPCKKPVGWKPSKGILQSLGLPESDGPVLEQAYAKTRDRQWAFIKPLCASVLGSADAAEKVGPSSCIHIVLDAAHEKNKDEANEAMRQVAEIRAGLRPMPPVDQQSTVMKLFLGVTGEAANFEADLAASLGPDEAHRIMYMKEGVCMGRNTFGGPGPREPEAK